MSDDNKTTETKKAPESVNSQDSAIQKKPKMALWKKILIGVVVFFVVIFVFAFFSTRSASNAANDFISDLQAGRCAEIYDRTSSEFRENGTAEEWNTVCQQISPILQGEPDQQGTEISSSTGSDQLSQSAYLIEGTDGATYRVTLELVNRDDVWQMNAFDSSVEE